MRSYRAAICVLAFSVLAPAYAADPVRAPGVQNPVDPIIPLVDRAITVTRQRNLDFKVHTPWQILHGLLALRNDYTVKNGSEFVNALDYISTTAKFKNERWFERTAVGAKAHPYNGTPYDFEGHVNQTLSIMAMCDLPLTHEFTLKDGSKATMADMVRHAQWAVTTKEETTWTLWFLTHYVDQDAQWKNFEGEQWSMERLVKVQNAASTYNAPCGGCHSLFALAYARNAYMQKHGKLQGAWLEADQKLQQYITAAQSMMNRDGSFATQYFKARGFSYDFNERIASSGHMIEWLMLALPRKRLDEAWLRQGVQTLANDLIRNASQPADCGPLYHSLHALILYKQRVDISPAPSIPSELAAKETVNAGPLTSSIPDGESMPLTAQQMREIHKTPVLESPKPATTVAADPKTVTPGTVVSIETPQASQKNSNEDPAETSKSVNDGDSTAALKPAPITSAPALLAPVTEGSSNLQPAPTTAMPAAADEASKKMDEADKKMTKSEGEKIEEATTESATTDTAASVKTTEPVQQLAPIEGGMPILKKGQGGNAAGDPSKKLVDRNDVINATKTGTVENAATGSTATTSSEKSATTTPEQTSKK